MSDLIERQAAIDALHMDIDIIPFAKAREYARAVIETVYNRLEELPSAQPEIIYCKNCIYYKWDIDMCDYPYSTAHNVVHEYDYCSKAERKTDE